MDLKLNTNQKYNNSYFKEILITDIDGFCYGQSTDAKNATGCNVILCPQGATGAVDVRGGGPATRETDLLKPENLVQKVHAVVLSGGSAYGLDAAAGVMEYLESLDIGLGVGVGLVPIVVGASLFDLNVANAHVRPDKSFGFEAAEKALMASKLKSGNFGAGTGATVGKILGNEYAMKSGIGCCALELGSLQVGAICACNALGDIYNLEGKKIAGLKPDNPLGAKNSVDALFALSASENPEMPISGTNTTISCVVTNANLLKSQALKVSQISHTAYGQCIRPTHTTNDGDAIFCLASCEGKFEVQTDIVGLLAVEALKRAIVRSVTSAETAYGFEGLKDSTN